MSDTTERILCAAIWYKDLPTQTLKATNQDKGLIVCGFRHGHIIDIVNQLSQLRTVQFGPNHTGESIQGFLTNKNRFVDRKEAATIAYQANQIQTQIQRLHSEDLY